MTLNTLNKNYFVTCVKITAFRELIIKLLYLITRFGAKKERPKKKKDFGLKHEYLRIITKNPAADQEKGFLTKSLSKPNGCATAMPTAWELNFGLK